MINLDRWNKFTLHQKLGNIGSEVTRARILDEKNDTTSRDASLERVLEMLNATLTNNISSSAIKELSKAKELIKNWKNDTNFQFSPKILEEYFTQFSYLL